MTPSPRKGLEVKNSQEEMEKRLTSPPKKEENDNPQFFRES